MLANRSCRFLSLILLLSLIPFVQTASAQSQNLEPMIRRFEADYESLRFKYAIPMSQSQSDRFVGFYKRKLDELAEVNFEELSIDGKVDYLLLKNKVRHELDQIETDRKKDQQIGELIPFADTIVGLLEAKENGDEVEGRKSAESLEQLAVEIEELKSWVNEGTLSAADSTNAIRASRRVYRLQRSLGDWYRFYNGYDPMFTWWCKTPYRKANDVLGQYAALLKRKLGKVDDGDKSKIVGEPIGNEALIKALKFEHIPYSPTELIEIANREFEWCEKEMLRASQELGFKGDWRAAQDSVKRKFVEPGQQPKLIREMAIEAVEFIEKRDLVTVPKLCKETWRMRMMSPERQRVSPYFLGGDTILVSYPTDDMEHSDKLMSLRGNNPHFSRAVVHHELIPGHHLQGFMRDRHRSYRRIFNTPFWVEGWALYWEMRLWDLDFARSAEDRVGMLFWRKHRCARIIFSLSYHLNKMSPEECVDFLVERVGHERNNATGEVRRSVQGGYGPLYQAAYMLGGLQIRAMYKELVESGTIVEKDFHDAILQQNSIPIELIRARFKKQELTPDFETSWRFAD
jgi:uncharacterized protein (DUF885 family)